MQHRIFLSMRNILLSHQLCQQHSQAALMVLKLTFNSFWYQLFWYRNVVHSELNNIAVSLNLHLWQCLKQTDVSSHKQNSSCTLDTISWACNVFGKYFFLVLPFSKCLEEGLSAQPVTSDGLSHWRQHESKSAENTHCVKARRARLQVSEFLRKLECTAAACCLHAVCNFALCLTALGASVQHSAESSSKFKL